MTKKNLHDKFIKHLAYNLDNTEDVLTNTCATKVN